MRLREASQVAPTAFRRVVMKAIHSAAFGGIVALNRAIDLPTAQAITAVDKLLKSSRSRPSFQPDALEAPKTTPLEKMYALLAVGESGQPRPQEFHLHKIVGGYLIQQRDSWKE